MHYNFKKLNNSEVAEVKNLLDIYADYDKLDIIIEMVISDKGEFLKRKIK
jgi:hypothetical protein